MFKTLTAECFMILYFFNTKDIVVKRIHNVEGNVRSLQLSFS